MKPIVPKKKIVWAVDPFCEDCPLLKRTARALSALASNWNAEVEPVYILGGIPPNVRLLPDLIRDIQSQAQTELKHLLHGVRIPDFIDLRLIAGPNGQIRSQADLLIEYAKKSGAHCIAVATRARKGPRRWILGSFAETLIYKSDVPLYIVNPHEAAPTRLKNILFATDFSDESKAAFKQVTGIAKEIGARLTLFHKIKYDLNPSVEVAFSAYPDYKEVFQQEVQARRNEAEEWAKEAETAGVKTEAIVDYRMGGSVAQAIVNRSGNRGGMIALAAHSGPIAAVLLGSVTRQVIRTAACPVWVIHNRQKKTAEKSFTVSEEEIMLDLTEHGQRLKRP